MPRILVHRLSSGNRLSSRCPPLQGCFRGLQDTRTPFAATVAVNVFNIGETQRPVRLAALLQHALVPPPPAPQVAMFARHLPPTRFSLLPTPSALEYCFIFVWHMGVQGAAAGTVLAQLLPCAWLLHRLSGRTRLRFAGADTLKGLAALLGPTGAR